MEMSVGITKGFHNLPRLWNDDTVRPQERVTDLKSGFKAIGREFGFGIYDGVSGLVTQPWQGARRDGATGFFKGVGKGLGGLAAKPGAAVFGIAGHFMKGVVKEVQNLFGSNVQNYIITSRVAQGYEEWMQSSEAEKQDVIDRWRLIQKDLKKKREPEKTVRGGPEVQQRESTGERPTSFAQSFISAQPSKNHGDAMVPMRPTGTATEAAQTNGIVGRPVPSRPASEQVFPAATSVSLPDDTQQSTLDNSGTEHPEAISHDHHIEQQEAWQDSSRLSRGQQDSASHSDGQESHVRAASFTSDLSSLAPAARDTYAHLSDSDWDATSVDADNAIETFDHQFREPGEMTAQSRPGVGLSSGSKNPPVYDQAHLAATSQSAFEAQHHSQQGEKTARERTEEEIVMEYVKKQSLLEVHHQAKRKGKGRAKMEEEADDEDLRKALEASMQDHE